MSDTHIRKIYLLTQTHTDLGYTDHLDSVMLHHRDIHDAALDLCEATFDAPAGEQMRWTCEVTATTLDYLRNTSSKNVERFVALHKAGRISVGALRYHWTPLVSKPLAIETLKDIDVLRKDFDVEIRSAMQCDVNGLAWFWNDLLVARGINFLSTHQNPHRGYHGTHVPSAWRWQNRSGGELMVHQGEHYGVGNFLRLAQEGHLDRDELMGFLHRHFESDDWHFGYSVLTHTHIANGDNVFPDPGLPKAVARWNETEDIPIEIVTLDQLSDIMAQNRDKMPIRSGEWMDSWCDGEAASPLETAAARSAERLLPLIQEFTNSNDATYRELVDALALYDEHTWGAHSAATAPHNIFSTIQRTQKSNHAYRAFALSLRMMAEGSRKAMPEAAGKVEGDHSFAAVSHDDLGPDDQNYLLANPYSFELDVDWPVPLDRGAGPQISIPQAYGMNHFFPGFGEDGWTDALQDIRPDRQHRLRAKLAPREARILAPSRVDHSDFAHGTTWIETPLTRLDFDPYTGGLLTWHDKSTGNKLDAMGSLSPQVQLQMAKYGRRQIYQAPYWERLDMPMGWNATEMFEDDHRDVSVGDSFIDMRGVQLPIKYSFGCGIEIDVVWTLTETSPWPKLTAVQKSPGFDPAFSVNWPMKLAGMDVTHVDTGDGLVDAIDGHVPSSCLGWQSVQSGIVMSGSNGLAVSIASPDAPLFQPGGPHTKEPHQRPKDTHGGVFWSINTHWDTNFPVRVSDHVPFRLTLGFDPSGVESAGQLLQHMSALPIIVRAPYAMPGSVDRYWPSENEKDANL